jgi:tetratricopeptide (TPR) repeat protein
MELIITEKKAPPTLCLNMIVKNESKIITRLFDSVCNIIDTYCICDTGSTDNTIELITNYFESKNISGKVVYEPFKDFAHNRNVSLKHCIGMSDYILFLDADMVLQIKNFDKEMLRAADSFYILQGTEDFYYHNVRIVRNNGLYSYYGVTHEYINTPQNNVNINISKDVLFIDDIGDGGSKGNKFDRDVALLTKGIEEDPNNVRYHFYLANSYFDSGKKEHEQLAIDYYKKRIELGGWYQEVWYSLYRIGLLYKRMDKMGDAIFHWIAAYECFQDRIENLYEIIQYYRIIGQCKSALVFYKLAKSILDKNLNWSEYLFLQNDVYTYRLEVEYTIISAYNGISNINKEVVTIMNKGTDQNAINNLLSNMKFYKDILVHTKKINISNKLFHNINGVYTHFNSSSSCIIPNSDSTGYLMNMRLVNYNIDGNGFYHNCDKHIITINKYLELDSNFVTKRERIINFEFVDRRYIGIEDVRIFRTNCDNESDALKFIGTGYHENNKIGIVHGNYCPLNDDNSLKLQEIVPSFANSDCEKNWVYVNLSGELHVVYNWGPLKLCKIDEAAGKLNLIKTIEMPNIFNSVRGSTCGANYKNEIWFIGHIVSYEQPRHYYHIFSVFDENMKLLRYSAPFKFDTECIEYCLGLIVEDDRVICTYSSWDRTTIIAVYDKKYIDKLVIHN